MNFLWLFGKSPSMSTIKNKRPAEASMIYSADGKLIGKFFSENRTPVEYEEVNPVFWHALIDTEDERFFSHHGIDYTAFAAVATTPRTSVSSVITASTTPPSPPSPRSMCCIATHEAPLPSPNSSPRTCSARVPNTLRACWATSLV